MRARAISARIISAFEGSSLSVAIDVPLPLARFNESRVNFFVSRDILHDRNVMLVTSVLLYDNIIYHASSGSINSTFNERKN